MRFLVVLGVLFAAVPAVAGDNADARPVLRPPAAASFTHPRWPAHLSAEQHYRRGQSERSQGTVLTATGTVIFVGGVVFAGLSLQAGGRPCGNQGQNCYQPLYYGVMAVLAGMASVPFLAVGIPLWLRGDRRMIQARPYLVVDPQAAASAGFVVTGRF